MKLLPFVATLIACLAPTFYFARTVDGDEFIKSATAVGLASVVVGAYSIYERNQRKA